MAGFVGVKWSTLFAVMGLYMVNDKHFSVLVTTCETNEQMAQLQGFFALENLDSLILNG